MVARKPSNTASGKGSLVIIIVYLVLSIFSALVFSVLFRKSVSSGKKGIGWFILTILSVAFYGFLAYSLVVTSSPQKDAGYYWIGITTLITNSLALILLFHKLIRK